MVQRVLRHDVMKPEWTVQFWHSTFSSDLLVCVCRSCRRRGSWSLALFDVAHMELSSPSVGNGAYSAGVVERSAIVLAIEYVPRNATMTLFGKGGCETAM